MKLPEPDHTALAFVSRRSNQSPMVAYYTEAQMLQAIRDAMEEAASICELHAEGWKKEPGENPHAGYVASSNCAAAIRKRKESVK